MYSLNDIVLESNKYLKINFDGGDLSSDAGLLLFKEFLFKIGAVKLINRIFKTNDTAWFRIHKDDANLMQVIYQIISACFEDDCADELTNEPVMTAILDKAALASQPTLSRFFNRMDKDTLEQLNRIIRKLRKIVYSIKKPDFMLFDIDSTLLDTYGHQEGEGFNFHYQAHGYHPLLCYDGLTGDLLKAELAMAPCIAAKRPMISCDPFWMSSLPIIRVCHCIFVVIVVLHHPTCMKCLKPKTANMLSG